MAIAFVSAVSAQGNSNPTNVTGAIDTTGANFLVATLISNQGATGFTSFTDSKGNTWNQVAVDWTSNGGDFVRIMYVENPTVGAAHTFTLTYSGSVFTVVNVAAYSGMATSSSLDKTATGTGNSTSLLTSATATTTQADELLIGGGTINAGTNSTFTAGASYTVRAQEGLAGSGADGFLEDRIVSSTGAYTASATWGGSAGAWIAAIATFKAAASSPATLSSATPSGTLATAASATLGATSNQTTGTFYGVVDTAGNISGITAAQIKAGQNKNSVAAVAASNSAVSTTTPSTAVSGLTPNTAYSYAVVQNNAGGDSNVLTGTFTTAVMPPLLAVRRTYFVDQSVIQF